MDIMMEQDRLKKIKEDELAKEAKYKSKLKYCIKFNGK